MIQTLNNKVKTSVADMDVMNIPRPAERKAKHRYEQLIARGAPDRRIGRAAFRLFKQLMQRQKRNGL